MEYNTVEIYNDIQTMKPKYDNFGDNLYWAWACWQMLWTYGKMGKTSFDKVFYMMRSKRFKQYQNGEFEIHDLYELNKGKLRMGDYCCYCGAEVPNVYMKGIHDACVAGDESKYTTLKTLTDLEANCRMNCIPAGFRDMTATDYDTFLEERRLLMAKKIRTYFESL